MKYTLLLVLFSCVSGNLPDPSVINIKRFEDVLRKSNFVPLYSSVTSAGGPAYWSVDLKSPPVGSLPDYQGLRSRLIRELGNNTQVLRVESCIGAKYSIWRVTLATKPFI